MYVRHEVLSSCLAPGTAAATGAVAGIFLRAPSFTVFSGRAAVLYVS